MRALQLRADSVACGRNNWSRLGLSAGLLAVCPSRVYKLITVLQMAIVQGGPCFKSGLPFHDTQPAMDAVQSRAVSRSMWNFPQYGPGTPTSTEATSQDRKEKHQARDAVLAKNRKYSMFGQIAEYGGNRSQINADH